MFLRLEEQMPLVVGAGEVVVGVLTLPIVVAREVIP